MAITSQAQHFLNAYFVLRQNEERLQRDQEERAQQYNAEHPNEEPVDQIGNTTDASVGVSYFVCLAFSVELFLKALFEAIGQSQRGHNIRELFEGLPPDMQIKVAETHMKNAYGWSVAEYKKQLDIISNGFEEFRYAYEHKELFYHQGFAINMIDAIKQVIKEIRAARV